MRAIQITSHEGPGALTVVDIEEPAAPPGSVVVDVHVAGVSFPEVLQSRGEYQMQPELPFVPGSEVAGVVRSAPAGSEVKVGQRVAAFPILGGFSEVVAVPPTRVFRLPDSVTFEVGASLLMNYMTVHFALTRRGRLKQGDNVLVHGAAGGIGTAAVQFAAALGATVIAVVSSEGKVDTARSAGAHHIVQADDFKESVQQLTAGRGVDLVVDPVGGNRFTDSLRSLAPEGRLLVIGFAGGEIPQVKVNRLLLNNISVVGVGWGAYWMTESSYLQEQWADLLPLIEAGELAPVLGGSYALEEASQALLELDERRALGKVLLKTR